MQPAVHADSMDCDYTSQHAASPARSTKLLVAGIAMASASVIAVNPVIATPAMPDVRATAIELSAFANPITEWQKTFTNTFTALGALGTGVSASTAALTQALSNPAVQAQFAGVFTGLNPQRIQNTLAALPGYGGRLGAAAAGFAGQLQEALAALPGVLQMSAGLLAQGKFLESFAEVNLWFLTAGLSDFRGAMLDAFRVPGDFLDSIGLEPLARILGTSWMVTSAPGAQIAGPGLLSRAVIGNLARALLGPPVTAMFQTMEIFDAFGAAVQAGDIQTALSELINAPAKIVNAFVNGYIPAFVGDPDGPFPPGPGQTFPGLLSPTGTLDFFFRQVPEEIAKALQFPRPTPPAPAVVTTSAADVTLVSASPSDIPSSSTLPLTLETPAAVETAPAVGEGAAPEGSTDTVVTTPEPESAGSGSGTSPVDDTDAGADDGAGANDGGDSEGSQGDTGGETKPSDTKPSDTKPSDTKSDDSKSDDKKSNDTKSDNGKSDNGKPSKTKSDDSKSSDAKSNDTKSSDNKSGGGDNKSSGGE
ncbi:hypothetical protein ABIA65_003755 [Mycolicibacterium sp. 624]